MAYELLGTEFNPLGYVEMTYYDDDTKKLTVITKSDVSTLMDKQKEKRNSGVNGWSESRDFREVMEVDFVTLEWLKQTKGLDYMNPDHGKAIKKFFTQRDYKNFLSVDGKV
jgi:hypothetical protein